MGCGIAALAMLTGESYADVRAAIDNTEWFQPSDWREYGVNGMTMERYLVSRGFFMRRVYRQSDFGAWPPPPFAERHYAQVAQPSGNGHYVVVDNAGDVLDPLREGAFRLAQWDVVNHVIGLTRA